MRRILLVATGLVGLVACKDELGPQIDAPSGLSYRIEPSGDPDAPSGVLLSWTPVNDPDLQVYRVYSRGADGAPFDLRASTTSTTYHDVGQPDLDYYVTALSLRDRESDHSNTVRIDERLRLPAPATLTSITLNGAIHLKWADNAFTSRPSGFSLYRLYSTSYDLDADLCGTDWSLEGTTVSPEFLASSLTNGVSRCFGVSAESTEGFESLWSPLRADTPRPDARNLLVHTFEDDASRSGFRFFLDANGDGSASALELGNVADGNRTDIDFYVSRDVAGDVFIYPVRTGTSVVGYGYVDDLTSIDVAPTSGFATSAIQAQPGYGYVFQMPGSDQFARFGAIRMTHVGQDYVIFDWSYQTDPGNPELNVVNRFQGGIVVVQK